MKRALKLASKLALAAGLALSLGFGTREAAACSTCTQPSVECEDEPQPNQFCDNLCVTQQGCFGGECQGPFGCVCFER